MAKAKGASKKNEEAAVNRTLPEGAPDRIVDDLGSRIDKLIAEVAESNKGPATLAAKMARVMGKVGWIKKSGFNEHFKYPFATAEDVAASIREQLAEESIAFLPSMLSVEKIGKDGFRSLIKMEMSFVCGETGERFTTLWHGEADDRQDKGINKAATSACKYFLIKTFMVSTGDEPDTDREAPVKQPKANPEPRRNPQARETHKGINQHSRDLIHKGLGDAFVNLWAKVIALDPAELVEDRELLLEIHDAAKIRLGGQKEPEDVWSTVGVTIGKGAEVKGGQVQQFCVQLGMLRDQISHTASEES